MYLTCYHRFRSEVASFTITEPHQDGQVLLWIGIEPGGVFLAEHPTADAAFRAISEARTGYQPWDSIGSERAAIMAREASQWELLRLGTSDDRTDTHHVLAPCSQIPPREPQ